QKRGVNFRLTLHETFDDAILERVKADDSQASATIQYTQRTLEPSLELPQLIVDEHAQRLKGASRGILSRFPRPDSASNDCGELRRSLDRLRGTRRHDRLCNATCKPFFSECCNHFANLVDARPSEPGRDGLATCRVHTHIDRTVGAEAEAARRIVELRG